MKKTTLLNKTMKELSVAIIALMLLATPLFYALTRWFYAEDLIEVIAAVQQGNPVPAIDLEEDVAQGVLLQFILITLLTGVGILVTMRYLSRRMWRPFEQTLRAIERFRLEQGSRPTLPESDIEEFDRLNATLSRLMDNCLASYRVQKEFTENASHELQTPLAIMQSKLDVFLQQPELTDKQAATIQSLYEVTARISRLNRNLLLLAKMDNRQFEAQEVVDFAALVRGQLPLLESLTAGLTVRTVIADVSCCVSANRALFEVLFNNLVVNAVRYNIPDGEILINVSADGLSVSNTSALAPLDASHIFSRFYHPQGTMQGNGLGLAIAKAICDYHGWRIAYDYADGRHRFAISFA